MKNSSSKKDNILVTGANGFIGSYLCQKLVENGYEVFGLAFLRDASKLGEILKNNKFHLLYGDIRDKNFIEKIIKENNIKTIFHLAAVLPSNSDYNDPFSIFSTNVMGTLNLLDAAYKNRVLKFIFASTMSVYSEPPSYLPVDEKHPCWPDNIYGASKVSAEAFCNSYKESMEIYVLRYGGAYGFGQDGHYAMFNFINSSLKNEPITIHGDGSQTTDFVYIDDVTAGSVLAMESKKPGTYNIGGGEEISIKKLAEKIIKLTGSKSEIVLTGKETNRPFRFFLNIKKAKDNFGYSPAPLDKGLASYIFELKK